MLHHVNVQEKCNHACRYWVEVHVQSTIVNRTRDPKNVGIHQDGCHARHLPSPEKSHDPSVIIVFLFIDRLSSLRLNGSYHVGNQKCFHQISSAKSWPSSSVVSNIWQCNSLVILHSSGPRYFNSIAVQSSTFSTVEFIHGTSIQSLWFPEFFEQSKGIHNVEWELTRCHRLCWRILVTISP